MMKIVDYYNLVKPGIIRGNLVTALGGFFLSSKGDISFFSLLSLIIGLSLVIASGCVFNNIIDRSIDKDMERTQKRAIVTGRISMLSASIFGTIVGIIGLYVLYVWTTPLAAVLSVLGLFFYVVVYGVAKRTTVHSTLIGSLSGATPPVIGYTTVNGSLDMTAILLFLILVAWQMPHFYAISIYRKSEYENAGVPLLVLKRGVSAVKKQILFYTGLFVGSTLLLTLSEETGLVYFIVMTVIGLWWFRVALKGFSDENSGKWAGRMFGTSLVVLMLWSVLISIDFLLP